jgi:hypothetical protein
MTNGEQLQGLSGIVIFDSRFLFSFNRQSRRIKLQQTNLNQSIMDHGKVQIKNDEMIFNGLSPIPQGSIEQNAVNRNCVSFSNTIHFKKT